MNGLLNLHRLIAEIAEHLTDVLTLSNGLIADYID